MESVTILIVRVLVAPLVKAQRLTASITLFGLCKGYSLKNIRLLIKQSALETGYWSDYKFNDHNNPWGMMNPSWSTYTTGSVGIESQGVYPTIHHAVLDRLTWDKRNNVSPRGDYYLENVQAAGYNSNPNYAENCKAFTPEMSGYYYALVLLPTSFVGAVYLIR